MGGALAGAEVAVVSKTSTETRHYTTDSAGNYFVPLLPPGHYEVGISARGFEGIKFNDVSVALSKTSLVNANLQVESVSSSITVQAANPSVQWEGPQRGLLVDSRSLESLPLATLNFTQILALSPGASVPLPDQTTVGRNSQDISVNGGRVTQNNYQINGVDANTWGTNTAGRIAVPAPESISEFKVNTSIYDATLGRYGGGNIQLVTKSGGNELHGTAYAYLQNEALNANNPFLKAAGVAQPLLRRDVLGGTLGGPIRKDRAFFLISYQGVREKNGATANSLSSNVLVAPCWSGGCLTDDRSERTLVSTFKPSLPNGQPLNSINPIALTLLQTRLPDGHFLIPTPQVDGHYSGSAPSHYQEDQFNTNFDYLFNETNSLAVKFFFSNSSSNLTLFSGPNVPGFGPDQEVNNRLAALRYVHLFNSQVINEVRMGANFIPYNSIPQEPINDSDVGIYRANADAKPGLSLIRIAPDAQGIAFGTAASNIDFEDNEQAMTLADILSIIHGKHSLRVGAEFREYRNILRTSLNTRGQIDFNNFNDFLIGRPRLSVFGAGIDGRDLRAADYNFFIQDDWKVSPKLTLNLGLRYDLDLPPYDTRGRISTFDPTLYKPRPPLGNTGAPIGPPVGGFVQAGNVISQYDLSEVPNVSARILQSNDPNNFAPRLGIAYLPSNSGRLVVRAGYGVFYSRLSNLYLGSTIRTPPYYAIARRPFPSFSDPFFPLPSQAEFPTFVPGLALANQVFDRNIRTPYLHQYSLSIQYELGANLLVEAAYVGTRALNLFRVVGINQSRLASPDHPILNEVNGQSITTNTPANAQLRAPFQGVSTNTFGQNETTAQSTYNGLQMSVTRRFSKEIQFLASYTYAKSIDNTASATTSENGVANEVAFSPGNQLDNRANRGLSDFDHTQRFVGSYLWDLPNPGNSAKSQASRWLLSNWQVAGIVVAMSGLPIDIVDSEAGSFYGLSGGNALARPNLAPGINPHGNGLPGYYFNPFAFVRPAVRSGQPIPSSEGTAVAAALGTDIGFIGRNILRGPRQANIDLSVAKSCPVGESKNLQFRVEFFNLLNQVNLANPVSNLNAVASSGGAIDPNTGQIVGNAGDFGRINSTSNNPRLIQFSLRFTF